MSDALAFNATIYSKLGWMGRQLRHIDDYQSLKAWVNTMHQIKNLLIAPTHVNTIKSPTHRSNSTQSSTYLPSRSSLYNLKYPPGLAPSINRPTLCRSRSDTWNTPHRVPAATCKPALARSPSMVHDYTPSPAAKCPTIEKHLFSISISPNSDPSPNLSESLTAKESVNPALDLSTASANVPIPSISNIQEQKSYW